MSGINPNADSKCIGKFYSKKDKDSSGSQRGAHEILIINFHFHLLGMPTNELE